MGRHTLRLDEDNERCLEEEQKKTGKSFKAVVNDLLREVREFFCCTRRSASIPNMRQRSPGSKRG